MKKIGLEYLHHRLNGHLINRDTLLKVFLKFTSSGKVLTSVNSLAGEIRVNSDTEGANPLGNAQVTRTAEEILALESEAKVSTEGFNLILKLEVRESLRYQDRGAVD